MILWALIDLHDDLELFFIVVPLAIIALIPMLVFHEVSHGMVASWLGDDTAKDLGRLSLNPLKHLDKAGTIMLLLVGFGWAKPVPVNPYRLDVDPRKGMAIVSAAGPLSNFAMALIFSLFFRLGVVELPYGLEDLSFSDVLGLLLLYIVQINVILGTLNSIPVPPLDGFKIVVGVLPREYALSFARIERYTPQIILVFVFLIMFTGFLGGIVSFLTNVFIGQEIY